MAVDIKHKFVSSVPDSGDSTIVQPTDWNNSHDLTLGGEKLLGRYSTGNGAAQEISLGAGLEFSGTELKPNVGTTAGTVAAGNDSRFSDIVSQVEAEAGSATTARVWTAQRVRQNASAIAFGIGQTLQTVTRTSGTVYQNSTSKPIMVLAGVTAAGDNAAITISTGSTASVSFLAQQNALPGMDGTVTTIIPPGWYYKIDAAGAVGAMYVRELR